MKVNPDPHKDGFELQPTNNVTAEMKTFEDAEAVSAELDALGFKKDDIKVFVGEEGLKKIDFEGDDHGIYGFLVRSIQHISHEWRLHASATIALKEGRVLIGILTDGSEDQISRVVDVLKSNDADAIVFWGNLSTKEF